MAFYGPGHPPRLLGHCRKVGGFHAKSAKEENREDAKRPRARQAPCLAATSSAKHGHAADTTSSRSSLLRALRVKPRKRAAPRVHGDASFG